MGGVKSKMMRRGDDVLKAAMKGDCQRLETLIATGPDVNHVNKDGITPLIAASMHGHDKCLEMLLKAGADVNACNNNNGSLALIKAAFTGFDKCVNVLANAGADVNFRDTHGRTALEGAIVWGYDKCVDELIKAGADVNKYVGHVTPLMLAAEHGRFTLVDLLIQAGADVNVTNSHGSTALLLAAAHVHTLSFKTNPRNSNNVKCVKLLLKSGAEINKSNILNKCACTPRNFPSEFTRQLIFAASENLNAINVKDEWFENIQEQDRRLCLKHMCRQAIRHRLLQLDQVNLFYKVSHLGLPKSLSAYLVYDISLEDEDVDNDDEDDDPHWIKELQL